jgi:hypothetical protein
MISLFDEYSSHSGALPELLISCHHSFLLGAQYEYQMLLPFAALQ